MLLITCRRFINLSKRILRAEGLMKYNEKNKLKKVKYSCGGPETGHRSDSYNLLLSKVFGQKFVEEVPAGIFGRSLKSQRRSPPQDTCWGAPEACGSASVAWPFLAEDRGKAAQTTGTNTANKSCVSPSPADLGILVLVGSHKELPLTRCSTTWWRNGNQSFF